MAFSKARHPQPPWKYPSSQWQSQVLLKEAWQEGSGRPQGEICGEVSLLHGRGPRISFEPGVWILGGIYVNSGLCGSGSKGKAAFISRQSMREKRTTWKESFVQTCQKEDFIWGETGILLMIRSE